MKPFVTQSFKTVKNKVKHLKCWDSVEGAKKYIKNRSRGKRGKQQAVLKRRSRKARRRSDKTKIEYDIVFDNPKAKIKVEII